MRGKVTKPSTASETPQPPRPRPLRAPNWRRVGIRVSGLRVGQHLDVPGIGAGRQPPRTPRRTLLTCSCQNRRAEVACLERCLIPPSLSSCPVSRPGEDRALYELTDFEVLRGYFRL